MAVAGYEVRIKEDGGAYGSPIDVGNNLNYQFGGLDASTLYFAQVRSYDAAGNRSAWSSEVSATTDVPWTPASIAGIEHWYRAADESYADNAPVSIFTDRVGSAHLQASGSARPTFKINGGDPYIEFDGVDDLLSLNPAWPALTDCSICMVYEIVSDVAIYDRFLSSYTWEIMAPGTNSVSRFNSAGGAALDVATPSRPTGFRAAFFERVGTASKYRYAGNEVAAADGTTAFHQGAAIGGAMFGGNYANIRVKELMACSSGLSGGEYSNLMSYLLTRYGIVL